MDYHASRYRSHRLRNRGMRPGHRPFHWLAMSGIMPPMVASAGLHITSPISSTSLYQRMGDKPAIQPSWMISCGWPRLVAVSSRGGPNIKAGLFKVGRCQQSEWLSVLSPMRQDIAERRDSPLGRKGGVNVENEGWDFSHG